MKTIKEIVKSTLTHNSLSFEEDGEFLRLSIGGENVMMTIRIRCDEKVALMLAWASVDLYVPRDNQEAALAVINNWNAKNMCATLCMDSESGKVICRGGCNTDNGALNEDVVMLTLTAIIGLMDDAYLPLATTCLAPRSDGEDTAEIPVPELPTDSVRHSHVVPYNASEQFCWRPSNKGRK